MKDMGLDTQGAINTLYNAAMVMIVAFYTRCVADILSQEHTMHRLICTYFVKPSFPHQLYFFFSLVML